MEARLRDEDYELLRSTVREFVQKEVEPLRVKIDRDDFFPLDVFRKMGKMGLLGITVPEEYGGSGMDYRAQGIVEEELGYSSPSLALSYGAHSNLCLDNLYRNGSLEIRENFVPKLCSGEWIGSLGLTEPSSGSDALNMKTTAKRHGNKFVLNGSKTLITNAPYADLVLSYARTEESYTAFAVLSSDKGFSRGRKFDKMGMRGSPTGELFFDTVELDENRVVGKPGEGKRIILEGLNSERVILSYIFVGLAQRCFNEAMRYSHNRKQGGHRINEYQLIQEKISYMFIRLESSRLLTEKAVSMLSQNMGDPTYAAAAILHTTESAEYIAREAIQIHGGIGYIKDSGIEMFLRDAILGQIGAGTTEIRKQVLAKSLIKKFSES
ncbi:MAG TPA: acyl-CoA dehydrogenase family protein [Thermoplasmataceae archaeon]|nr:acyl-CoA dehydrogenase family protein [Thermoplasmatales archaeon AK]HLH85742.1 acyl-CoA dehydrogenase family protein [Thermoplasmataceae archaeon]